MIADPYTTQEEILTLLRTIPHVVVFRGGVPDAKAIPLTPTGKIAPHLEVSFAGLTEPAKGTNGTTGAADDSFLQKFSVHGIAGDPDAAAQVLSLATKKLFGFQPALCAEIRPDFFAGIGEISSLSQPTRYSAVQALRYLIL
jgi:hypothetical protein